MRSDVIIAGMFAGLVFGCTATTKEYVPVETGTAPIRVPNQQRIVALSVQDAVKKACASLNLRQYAGRTARVEVNGVFPHSAADLLDYIASGVEGEASASGLVVLPRPDLTDAPEVVVNTGAPPPPHPPSAAAPQQSAVPGAAPAVADPYPPPAPPVAAPPALPSQAASPVLPPMKPEDVPADVRLVVSVDWGGIDVKDDTYVKPWPLVGQVLGGIAAGALIVYGIAGEDAEGAIIGGTVAAAGDITWAAVHSSIGHSYTLQGRTQLTIRAIPAQTGLAYSVSTGTGESAVVIDSNDPKGYRTTLPEFPR
jgi:hypothetical protein